MNINFIKTTLIVLVSGVAGAGILLISLCKAWGF